jgi:thioredoxin-like negative regulator of GroEL
VRSVPRGQIDTADPDNGRLTGLITAAPTLKVAAGEFQRAADLYNQIGAQPDAAFTRLQAAKRLVAADRRAEANAQLTQALAFYRQVNATGYLRKARHCSPSPP